MIPKYLPPLTNPSENIHLATIPASELESAPAQEVLSPSQPTDHGASYFWRDKLRSPVLTADSIVNASEAVRKETESRASSSQSIPQQKVTGEHVESSFSANNWQYMRSAKTSDFWNNLQVAQKFVGEAKNPVSAFSNILRQEISILQHKDALLPPLPTETAKQLTPMLTEAFSYLADSSLLDGMQTSERGRLIALMQYLNIERNGNSYALQMKGKIDESVAQHHLESAKRYIKDIELEPWLVQRLASDNSLNKLSVGDKELMVEMLVKKAASALGVKSPIVGLYASRPLHDHPDAAALTTKGYPSRLILTNDIFKKGAFFVINTVMHEVEHVRQFEIDNQCRKQKLFSSSTGKSKATAEKKSEPAGLRYYNLAIVAGDKKPAVNLFDHRYGRESERHAWAVGLSAAILAGHSPIFAKEATGAFSVMHVDDEHTDIWQTVISTLEQKMGVSVHDLASLIPGKSQASTISGSQGWAAIKKLMELHESRDSAGTLSVALLSGAPEIELRSSQQLDGHGEKITAALLKNSIENALIASHTPVLLEKIRSTFFTSFPPPGKLSVDMAPAFIDSLKKVSMNGCKSDFSKYVLFDVAMASLPKEASSMQASMFNNMLKNAIWDQHTDTVSMDGCSYAGNLGYSSDEQQQLPSTQPR